MSEQLFHVYWATKKDHGRVTEEPMTEKQANAHVEICRRDNPEIRYWINPVYGPAEGAVLKIYELIVIWGISQNPAELPDLIADIEGECEAVFDAGDLVKSWGMEITPPMSTADLDTQPVGTLTICPNCVSAMEQTTSGDYVCPRCRYQIEGDDGPDTIILDEGR